MTKPWIWNQSDSATPSSQGPTATNPENNTNQSWSEGRGNKGSVRASSWRHTPSTHHRGGPRQQQSFNVHTQPFHTENSRDQSYQPNFIPNGTRRAGNRGGAGSHQASSARGGFIPSRQQLAAPAFSNTTPNEAVTIIQYPHPNSTAPTAQFKPFVQGPQNQQFFPQKITNQHVNGVGSINNDNTALEMDTQSAGRGSSRGGRGGRGRGRGRGAPGATRGGRGGSRGGYNGATEGENYSGDSQGSLFINDGHEDPDSDLDGDKEGSSDNRAVRFAENTDGHNRFAKLKAARDRERADLIRRGIIDDPENRKPLSEALVFVGTCQDMCPLFEREERQFQKNVDKLEMNLKTGIIDPKRAVKAFHRPAAGNDSALPSDVRPPKVLVRTLEYLIHVIVGRSSPLMDSHSFVRDRTRGIRQDFTLQNYRGQETIDCHERIARYHILCIHQLSQDDRFVLQQEMEQLQKTITTLNELYDDAKIDGIVCPNEPEFRAYQMLIYLHDEETPRRAQRWPFTDENPHVQAALKLHFTAFKNAPKFFRLLFSENVNYLMACIAEVHFFNIRKEHLRKIRLAYQKDATTVTVSEVSRQLGFDNEDQLVRLCEHFGMETARNSEGNEYIVPNRAFDDSRPQQKPIFNKRLVETKRRNRVWKDIINGIHFDKAQGPFSEDVEPEEEVNVPRKIESWAPEEETVDIPSWDVEYSSYNPEPPATNAFSVKPMQPLPNAFSVQSFPSAQGGATQPPAFPPQPAFSTPQSAFSAFTSKRMQQAQPANNTTDTQQPASVFPAFSNNTSAPAFAAFAAVGSNPLSPSKQNAFRGAFGAPSSAFSNPSAPTNTTSAPANSFASSQQQNTQPQSSQQSAFAPQSTQAPTNGLFTSMKPLGGQALSGEQGKFMQSFMNNKLQEYMANNKQVETQEDIQRKLQQKIEDTKQEIARKEEATQLARAIERQQQARQNAIDNGANPGQPTLFQDLSKSMKPTAQAFQPTTSSSFSSVFAQPQPPAASDGQSIFSLSPVSSTEAPPASDAKPLFRFSNPYTESPPEPSITASPTSNVFRPQETGRSIFETKVEKPEPEPVREPTPELELEPEPEMPELPDPEVIIDEFSTYVDSRMRDLAQAPNPASRKRILAELKARLDEAMESGQVVSELQEILAIAISQTRLAFGVSTLWRMITAAKKRAAKMKALNAEKRKSLSLKEKGLMGIKNDQWVPVKMKLRPGDDIVKEGLLFRELNFDTVPLPDILIHPLSKALHSRNLKNTAWSVYALNAEPRAEYWWLRKFGLSSGVGLGVQTIETTLPEGNTFRVERVLPEPEPPADAGAIIYGCRAPNDMPNSQRFEADRNDLHLAVDYALRNNQYQRLALIIVCYRSPLDDTDADPYGEGGSVPRISKEGRKARLKAIRKALGLDSLPARVCGKEILLLETLKDLNLVPAFRKFSKHVVTTVGSGAEEGEATATVKTSQKRKLTAVKSRDTLRVSSNGSSPQVHKSATTLQTIALRRSRSPAENVRVAKTTTVAASKKVAGNVNGRAPKRKSLVWPMIESVNTSHNNHINPPSNLIADSATTLKRGTRHSLNGTNIQPTGGTTFIDITSLNGNGKGLDHSSSSKAKATTGDKIKRKLFNISNVGMTTDYWSLKSHGITLDPDTYPKPTDVTSTSTSTSTLPVITRKRPLERSRNGDDYHHDEYGPAKKRQSTSPEVNGGGGSGSGGYLFDFENDPVILEARRIREAPEYHPEREFPELVVVDDYMIGGLWGSG